MKIDHEIKDVKILRYGTLAHALTAVYGKKHYEDHRPDLVHGLLTSEFWVNNPNFEMLYAPLAWVHECELEYTRSCALVSFVREWSAEELRRVLLAKGYIPAGTSEAVAYLRELKRRNVKFGSILHLGTRILDEQYREQRFVTRDDGRPERLPFYGTMKLKSCHQIVVVKKENEHKK